MPVERAVVADARAAEGIIFIMHIIGLSAGAPPRGYPKGDTKCHCASKDAQR
jgi:hypothetical protein